MKQPPFRAEHIGSFLRPGNFLSGNLDVDAAITEVIRWQESLGLQVVTDGEFRRESWRLGFVTKVTGFSRADAVGDVDVQRDDAGWIGSGSYERIAERTFGTLEADALFLEYDTERAGGFEPLRFVPKGKRVVLGLVSTKTPLLEETSFLKKRIDAASRFLPLDSLSISPQCGFASHHKGTALTFEQQDAKLRRVVDVARDVWGEA